MPADTNLFIIFITGLTTGGLTCLALQGGLLTSVLSQNTETREKNRLLQNSNQSLLQKFFESPTLLSTTAFLTSKLVAHTLLGILLGFIGSSISLSPNLRGWFQIAIAIYLLGIAGNLLDLHPFFRYFVITPPKFLTKIVRNKSKSKNIFAPAILGALTIFIPCATTQAMEVLALGSGNPIYAGLIMFAFILGTSPTFLIFGFLLNSGSNSFRKYFPSIAGTALIFMSLYSLNGGLNLLGSVYTFQNFYEAAIGKPDTGKVKGATLSQDIQSAEIDVTNSGYSPTQITLKRGVKTKLTLKTDNVVNCSRSFTIPALGIQKLLPETGIVEIEFTPTKLGNLAYTCSMGMYSGRFTVIN